MMMSDMDIVTANQQAEPVPVRLGFLPLSDCAPLVVARKLALDLRHGIRIELLRQPSWAALRDKLLSGELDAAHALYSMALGIQLGIAGPRDEMSILMTLNRNGQAISLSRELIEATAEHGSLRQAIANLGRRAMLAHTFPTGTHAVWLREWLHTQGIDAMRDVQMMVIPPNQMVDAMANGELDGFCAGEPWHAVAVARGVGATIACSSEIWPDHPEKALICRRAWASLECGTAIALMQTLTQACRWLGEPGNLEQAALWLSEQNAVGVTPALILPRMLGDYGSAPLTAPPRLLTFQGNRPDPAEAVRFLGYFRTMGLWAGDDTAVCKQLCDSQLYDLAIPLPIVGSDGVLS